MKTFAEPPSRVIIHSSATRIGDTVDVDTIRKWHLARGWSDIGYHFIVDRAGLIHHGRDLKYIGAHTKGQNHDSIGICLLGGIDVDGEPEFNFKFRQLLETKKLIDILSVKYNFKTICGHRDFAQTECPGFNVAAMFK